MAVDAVLFDWGGTLTPWHTIDPAAEWRSVAAVVAPGEVDRATAALMAAAEMVWARSRDAHLSSTLEEVCRLAEIDYSERSFDGYRSFWEASTYTSPDAEPLFEALHAEGIKVGVLSNTLWPRPWHEEFFVRDGLAHLVDGAVYTSEIEWTKPAPEAFRAAMTSVAVTDPTRCVFVGDRLFDDIYGAHEVGMRAVYVPHSSIPASQVGHFEGEPDAVIDRLSDLLPVIAAWR
ncbi:MAG: HAD family hydrolase [Nocardioidaceae bacterium]